MNVIGKQCLFEYLRSALPIKGMTGRNPTKHEGREYVIHSDLSPSTAATGSRAELGSVDTVLWHPAEN